MKNKKFKCPICGNYTIENVLGDICPVCFAEYGFDNSDSETTEKNIEKYKKTGHISGDVNWIRQPIGIELAGFYEPKNNEAQNDIQYIFAKKCLEDKEKQYELAEEAFYDLGSDVVKWSENYKGVSKEEAFKIFNALAYDGSECGLNSTFALALCYATGCGCKADLSKAEEILKDISRYYEIYSEGKIIGCNQ